MLSEQNHFPMLLHDTDAGNNKFQQFQRTLERQFSWRDLVSDDVMKAIICTDEYAKQNWKMQNDSGFHSQVSVMSE